MGQLLDLVRSLKLDAPETWLPPEFVGPLEAQAQPPTFRTSNQVDAQGNPVVADESLPGWRGAADSALNALVGTVKGATGLGEQGPAGPSWQNFGALAAAVPMGMPEQFLGAIAQKLPRFAAALKAYRAPTDAGHLAAPFYSRLEDTIAGLPKQFGAGALAKGGASAEELAMRGVPEFLSQQGTRPMAKSALEGHLAVHPVPELQVKTLGEPAAPPKVVHTSTLEARPDYGGPSADVSPWATVDARTGEPYSFHQTRGNAEDYIKEFGADAPAPKPTKFSQYQLPGGTNYRETLITLPANRTMSTAAHEAYIAAKKAEDAVATEARRPVFEKFRAQIDAANAQAIDMNAAPSSRANARAVRDALERKRDAEASTAAEQAILSHPTATAHADRARAALQQAEATERAGRFTSSHFDEPNILVHTRSNEREIPGLGKGTFLEEVQSDWHQKGKDAGYDTGHPNAFELWKDSPDSSDAPQRTQAFFDALPHNFRAPYEQQAARARGGVPDAPFKDTWPDLALKHHLAEAAQNPETQWIGFTSGQTQAARYDLSKQISKVEFDAGDRQLRAFDHHGKQVIGQTTGPEHLADYIGKEAAQKLLATKPSLHPEDQTPIYTLAGVDLKVGGEGMHHFYDNLLPKRLEKIVKPYGGTVERVPMNAEKTAALARQNEMYYERGAISETEYLKRKAEMEQPIQAWVLRLTPELKQRILRYGLPLLTGVAAVEMGQGDR